MRLHRGSRIGGRVALVSGGKALVAGALCSMMVGQPVFAAAGSVKKTTATAEIRGDARVLHALNRFTFGPRPGDVAAVEAMGLDAWFEQQLNPAKIDDSALDQRLAAFPAMQLEQTELMRRFPNPQIIKAMARVGQGYAPAMPGDPVLHAVYADQVELYNIRFAAKSADGKGVPQPGNKKKAAQMGSMAGGSDAGDAAADSGGMNAGAMGGAAKANGSDGSMDAAMNGGGNGMDAAAQAKVENLNADPLAVVPEQHVDGLYPEDAAQKLINLAPDARMSAILGMQAREFAAFRRSLNRRELAQMNAGLNPGQREILMSLGGSSRVIGGELLQARVMRDVYSDRQLEAVMTDFWLNHFNVYLRKNQIEPYLIPSFERDVIRPRALGKFEDLLVATAKSPAMLTYLDNAQSVGPDSQLVTRGAARERIFGAGAKKGSAGLNENYGRELMELHTLGVGGGYTQADVTQVAKVFTGWTIDRPYRGGTFLFEPNRHEPGSKMVLGKKIEENGEGEGLEVLHMLATSPATAKFISTKLAVRFVSDDPPPALVDRMAAAFLSSQGDMKVVLRTMFKSPEFWSPAVYRAKVKTPLEFVVSAVRASDADVVNALPLVQALDRLGMPLYGMQTPNGYSWKEEPWVSTGALVSRMNFALVLSDGRVAGVRTEWPALVSETAGVRKVSAEMSSPEAQKERRLETVLLGEPVSERTRATVLAQFNDETAKDNAEKNFNLRGGDADAADAMKGQGAMKGYGGRRGFGGQAMLAPVGPQDAQAAGMAGLLLGSPEFQRR